MPKLNIVLDVPDDVVSVLERQLGTQMSLQDAMRIALECWVEVQCPLRFSAKLDKTDLLDCFVDLHTQHIPCDDHKQQVHSVISELYQFLDRFLKNCVNPHRLVVADGISPFAGSLHISLFDVVF